MSTAESHPEKTSRTRCVVCGGDQWTLVREGTDLYRSNSSTRYKLSRCVLCGHIAQNQPPDDEELRIAYSSEYAPYRPAWKQTGWPLWKILRELTTQRRVSRLKRYARGNKLIEVGIGAGDFLRAAHRAGWDVRGVEYSTDLAETLRKELGFDVRAGDLKPGLWEDGPFDLIVCWSVLEHLRDPLETLQTASAYLRTGGAVFIQIPTRDGAELGKWFGQYWALLDLPRHLNFFGRTSLTTLCDRAGLDLIAFKTPLLDTAWCYFASSASYPSQSTNKLQKQLRFAALASTILLALPWLAIESWRGRGTEAFAVAIKR